MASETGTAGNLYLDLLKNCLTGTLGHESYRLVGPGAHRVPRMILGKLPFSVVQRVSREERRGGRDWPADGETMIGIARLDSLQSCIESVLRDQVPGDLLEAGVWRGGASIFMRAVLKINSVADRLVWVADSFRGLPSPNVDRYPADRGNTLHTNSYLAVPLAEVRANFEKYGLLDEQVRFLPGWFRETLPAAPIDRLAVLRLDGDLYESTMDGLRNLYSKLAVGGYVIIDDYWADGLPAKRAVDEFRAENEISERIERIDSSGALWRRSV